MKARIILLILIGLSLFCGTMLYADSEELKISVLYFDNTSGSEKFAWLEKGLADMLLTDLSLSPEIKIIEREQLEKVLEEQKFSLSGITDEDQSIEIGRLLSANLLLTGSFVEAGGRLRIDSKLLNTETGEIRAAVKSEGNSTLVFDLESDIARNIFEQLGLDEPEGINKSKPESFTAVESYYKGLDLFDAGKYTEAVEYYNAAALEAPEYGKPRAGLEESYKFLKDFRNMRYQREINNLLTKAEVLRNRLEREPWMTYADFLMDAYSRGITDNTELNKQAEAMGLLSGETPAVCAWNLQTNLYEIADLSIEYFEDEELAEYSYLEIIDISQKARKLWQSDPFLPELIYQELLVTYFEDEYEKSMVLCEELMINYPDYRMMWAVEDFYEESLEELEGGD